MKTSKIKFKHLGGKEMILLLKALGYKLNKSKCQFCKDKLKVNKFGILPPTDKRRTASLVCNSPLCVCEYLEKMDS